MAIYAEHKADSEIKTYRGGSAGAEKGEGDADNRQEGQNHSDVYDKLAGKHGKNAGANYFSRFVSRFSRNLENSEANRRYKADCEKAADKTELLSHRGKNEIVKSQRDFSVLNIGAVKKTVSEKASRADGNTYSENTVLR